MSSADCLKLLRKKYELIMVMKNNLEQQQAFLSQSQQNFTSEVFDPENFEFDEQHIFDFVDEQDNLITAIDEITELIEKTYNPGYGEDLSEVLNMNRLISETFKRCVKIHKENIELVKNLSRILNKNIIDLRKKKTMLLKSNVTKPNIQTRGYYFDTQIGK